MYVYTHIYMYIVHIYAHIHEYLRKHIHTFTCILTHTCIYAHIYHGSKPLPDTIFQRFFVAKVVSSTENVKFENFMRGESREEKFLNGSVR